MATATQIATRALRRLGVVSAGENPASADVSDAKEALTAMIASWEAEGLTGDILPLDARFEQGVVAMLAVRLAEEYGKTPGEVMVRDAKQGWDQISSAFFSVPKSTFDDGIVNTGHWYQYGIIVGQEGDSLYTPWAASTAYRLREYVQNGSMIYECITAGTSASSGGPTGTGPEITDGTVTWCWRRVAGNPDAE